jgi:hypothetical protein
MVFHPSEKTMPSIYLTLFETSDGSPCGKRITRGPDGALHKTSLAGALAQSNQRRVSVAGAEDLAQLLDGLQTHQALAYGIADIESSAVVTKRAKAKGAEGITRTRDNFHWPHGPGVMLIDYDPRPGADPLSRDALLGVLYELCPALEHAPHVWRPSAASCIYRTDTGEQVQGVAGQRVYVLVADATDTPRAGEQLHRRAWLSGHGFIVVGSAGQLLDRGPVDASVWQAERLDYAGGASPGDGLEQRLPAAMVLGGDTPLDTRQALPDLSQADLRTVRDRVEAAKDEKRPEQATVREAYIETQGEALAKARGIDLDQAKSVVRDAAENRVLSGDFTLRYGPDPSETVTVDGLLAQATRWHKHGFLDPLEPNYDPHNFDIARAYLVGKGAPFVHSFAHGGYRCRLEPGNKPTDRWANVQPPKDFRLNSAGVLHVRKKQKADGSGELYDQIEQITLAPIWVDALSRDNSKKHWGRLVCWIDLDGRYHERAIPEGAIHAQGSDLVSMLASEGVAIIPGMGRLLVQYLGRFNIQTRLIAAPTTGWVDQAFVLPDCIVSGSSDERIVYQPEGGADIAAAISVSGNADDWRQGMRDASPLVIFTVSASLSAPIRYLVGLEAGGFNMYGPTARGKTTVLQCSASVWGRGCDPAQCGGAAAYIQRWSSTANALEAKAGFFSDLPFVVDEIGEGDAQTFGQSIYRISSGTGRSRARRDGSLADGRSWRVMVLSAGELPVSDYLVEGGRAVCGGQLVRLVDIPIGEAFGCGRDADRMKALCSEHFGHAGRELLRSGDLTEGWDAFDRDTIGSAMTPEAGRVRERFALVCHAGQLASRRGIVPWAVEQVVNACRVSYVSWQGTISGASEAERGIRNVRDFIMIHGSARFERDDDAGSMGSQRRAVINRAGWMRDGIFHFHPKAFKEACDGVSPDVVKRSLHAAGHLHIADGARLSARIRVNSGRVRVVSVKARLLDSGVDGREGGAAPHRLRAVPSVPCDEGPVGAAETLATQGLSPASPASPAKISKAESASHVKSDQFHGDSTGEDLGVEI